VIVVKHVLLGRRVVRIAPDINCSNEHRATNIEGVNCYISPKHDTFPLRKYLLVTHRLQISFCVSVKASVGTLVARAHLLQRPALQEVAEAVVVAGTRLSV
jgi:hypothetical protein